MRKSEDRCEKCAFCGNFVYTIITKWKWKLSYTGQVVRQISVSKCYIRNMRTNLLITPTIFMLAHTFGNKSCMVCPYVVSNQKFKIILDRRLRLILCSNILIPEIKSSLTSEILGSITMKQEDSPCLTTCPK